MSDLVRMEKDGAALRVHPSTVEAHKAAGWAIAPEPAPEPAQDDTAALRAEYEAMLGKKPFMGWDADELRKRMASAGA